MDKTLEEMIREDMIANGFEPSIKEDIIRYWKERLDD